MGTIVSGVINTVIGFAVGMHMVHETMQASASTLAALSN